MSAGQQQPYTPRLPVPVIQEAIKFEIMLVPLPGPCGSIVCSPASDRGRSQARVEPRQPAASMVASAHVTHITMQSACQPCRRLIAAGCLPGRVPRLGRVSVAATILAAGVPHHDHPGRQRGSVPAPCSNSVSLDGLDPPGEEGGQDIEFFR
jgi:hypothetical protein